MGARAVLATPPLRARGPPARVGRARVRAGAVRAGRGGAGVGAAAAAAAAVAALAILPPAPAETAAAYALSPPQAAEAEGASAAAAARSEMYVAPSARAAVTSAIGDAAEEIEMKRAFEPEKYLGVWYEVASQKDGFAGEGQSDCHCTQGIYTYDDARRVIEVSTFCVHQDGTPGGRVSGIRGEVNCISDPTEFERSLSPLEREEDIVGKCTLKFPSLPFVLPLPYDVIATDYDNVALVQGAKSQSFVQIYSRVPNPGADFIARQKALLASLGYAPERIRDTPQDCPAGERTIDDMRRRVDLDGGEEVVPDEGGSGEAGVSQKLRDAMVAATDAVRNVPNPLESANVEKLLPKVNIIKTARDLISLSLRGGE